jgi:hypothetical protein
VEDRALTTIDGQVLAERPVQMIRPLATPDEALEAWQAFQLLKAKLVTADDIQPVQGKNAIKKSGWRKIAAAFGLDTELVSEERIPSPNGPGFTVETTVRATAPNGRHADGVGSCDTGESRFRKNSDHIEHDVRSTAYTRACNRAISDLVGGGEVSAEEMRADAAPPVIDRAQARAVADKFLKALLDADAPMPSEEAIVTACVMARGDLRRAWKLLQEQAPNPEPEPEIALESVDDD